MRRRAVHGGDVEVHPEMIAVVVAGRNGDPGSVLAVHRHEQLGLEVLGRLVGGEHAAGAAEEGVGRGRPPHREAEVGEQIGGARDPGVTVRDGRPVRADADDLAHAEGLHPRRVRGGLAAEAVAGDVDPSAVARQLPAQHRVHGVAGRRDERDVARVEMAAPVVAGVAAREPQAVVRGAPGGGGDRGGELREGRDVVGPVEVLARHHRREGQHRGGAAVHVAHRRADEGLDRSGEVRERGAVPVHAVDARRDEQPRVEEGGAELLLARVQVSKVDRTRCCGLRHRSLLRGWNRCHCNMLPG